MNYLERIVRDPQIVGGEPVFKGTRVTLRSVLASLAEGGTTAEISSAVSGRAILRGLIEGETTPDRLLARTTGLLRADPEQLHAALEGHVRARVSMSDRLAVCAGSAGAGGRGPGSGRADADRNGGPARPYGCGLPPPSRTECIGAGPAAIHRVIASTAS